MGPKFKTINSAEKMHRQVTFDKMDEAEREKFGAHCKKLGTTPDEFIKSWAGSSVKSVENGWEGFKQCAVALHSNWGFTFPLDAERARGKVLIKVARGDELRPGMGEYLAQNYASSEFTVGEGGHISGIYTLNEDIAYLIPQIIKF